MGSGTILRTSEKENGILWTGITGRQESRLIKFGRFAQQDAPKKGTKAVTFDFLGFTHYCSANKSGQFRVKRKTSRKKFKKKCKEMWIYIRENRHMPTDMLIRKLNEVLIGYDHYYGITEKYASLQNFTSM